MGEHQLDNAATAIAAARILQLDGFPQICADAIAKGLSAANLLGRFQVCNMPTKSCLLKGNARMLLWEYDSVQN